MTDQPTIKLTSTTVEFSYDVAGAEAVALRFGKARFLPVKATITVTDGRWTQVKLSGSNAKKDGTSGANFHAQNYHNRSWDIDEMPEWVRDLATQAQRQYADMDNAVRVARD